MLHIFTIPLCGISESFSRNMNYNLDLYHNHEIAYHNNMILAEFEEVINWAVIDMINADNWHVEQFLATSMYQSFTHWYILQSTNHYSKPWFTDHPPHCDHLSWEDNNFQNLSSIFTQNINNIKSPKQAIGWLLWYHNATNFHTSFTANKLQPFFKTTSASLKQVKIFILN